MHIKEQLEREKKKTSKRNWKVVEKFFLLLVKSRQRHAPGKAAFSTRDGGKLKRVFAPNAILIAFLICILFVCGFPPFSILKRGRLKFIGRTSERKNEKSWISSAAKNGSAISISLLFNCKIIYGRWRLRSTQIWIVFRQKFTRLQIFLLYFFNDRKLSGEMITHMLHNCKLSVRLTTQIEN